MNWYIDSSAIIKLIKPEAETAALLKIISSSLISSQLCRVEVFRTINLTNSALLESAHDVLIDIQMFPIENSILAIAENFPSLIELRALASIHLATAISLRNAIQGIITYDKELAKAAITLGFEVLSPGMK